MLVGNARQGQRESGANSGAEASSGRGCRSPSSLSDTPYWGWMSQAPWWQGDNPHPGEKKGPEGVL